MLDTSTETLLDLYEHAPCGFHSLDANGIFLRVNDTELQWLGYKREEMIGRMNLDDILTLEGQRMFAENFPGLKKTGVLRDLECDFVRKDRTLLPVLVSASAVWNPNGEFKMSLSVVYDLTGSKQAENRFRTILEAAPDVILICNRRGLITLSGGQTEKVLGYRRGELAGQSIEILLPEKFRKAHREYVEGFFSHPEIRPMGSGRRLAALRKDGTEFPVEISLSPLQADEGPCTLAIVRDITSQRFAEDELHRSEELYHSVVAAMAEGVVLQDRNGQINACNASAERILGLSEDQLKGRTSVDPRWQAIHEDGSPFPGEMHPSMVALRTGQRQSSVCMGVRKPYGGTSWILINAEPVFHSDTLTPRAVITTFTDITDRKKLEEELSQAQKMEAVGRLAGGIAHDFNNTLGIIIGHCDILRELSDDPRLLPHTDAIRKSALHATALTRQLLAFSRKQIMRMQPLDLNDIVRHLAEMLKRLIGENIDLILNLAPDPGVVNGDPVQIEQVVMNLVVNARDAMPNGGRLTISTASVAMDRETTVTRIPVLSGPYVMISVSDTGRGIERDAIAHLFEPFFTTKEMGRGTGLGLSIIYGVVQQSGGHITVESEVGHGSTFRVYLPRVADVKVPEPRPDLSSTAALEGGTETILLVEDDDGVREMVLSMLEPAGYKVLTASTAQEAITVSEGHSGPIALLLTDVLLRGSTDGRSLAQQMEANRPGIKVLFMTGYSESFIADSAVPGKVKNLIEKPFQSTDLRHRVRLVLDSCS